MPGVREIPPIALDVPRKSAKDADDILQILGNPGKFQMIQFVLLCSQFIPLAMSDLMPIFYGLQPKGLMWKKKDCAAMGLDPESDVFQFIYKNGQQRSITGDMNLICGRTWMVSFATTIYYLGQIVASPGAGWLADTYGRRPVLLISNVLYTVLSIALVFSQEYVSFTVLRFFIGMARQAMNTSFYVLMMEWISPQRRMSWAAMAQFSFTAGVLLLGLAAYLIQNWRYIQLVLALSNCLGLGLIWFGPESIKWLLFQNRTDQAQVICKTISQFNGMTMEPESLEDMKEIAKCLCVLRSSTKVYSVLDCLRTFHIRIFTLLCCFIWVAILTQYFGMMLLLSEISGDIYANFAINASLELIPRFLALFLTFKLSNRTTMMSYFFVGGVLAIVAGVIPGNNYSESLVKTIVSFLARMSVVGCFALAYTFTSELFPIAIRNSGFGLCSIAMRVGSMLAPQIAALENVYSFKGLPFVVMGCISLSAVLATSMLPETKGIKMVTTVEEAETLGHLGSWIGRLRGMSLNSWNCKRQKVKKSEPNAMLE